MNWKKETCVDSDLVKSILQHLPSSVVSVDSRGAIDFFNDQAEKIFGLQPNMVMSQAYLDACGISNADGTKLNWENYPTNLATRGETIEAFPILLNNKFVQNRQFLLTATPLRNEAGDVTGALETLQVPISSSELQKSSSNSRESAGSSTSTVDSETIELSMFRQLFDLMPQLGWTAHADGFIDWYNRGWYDYTGKDLQAMQGWGWESVHDPAILPSVVEQWKKSLASGAPFEMKFPLRGKDGQFRWFLTRIRPLKNESGSIVRWIGINVDIQDQIDEQKQMRLLSEALPNTVWTTDATGFCTYLSSQWKTMTGREPEASLGAKWLENLHPDDRDRTWETWQQCVDRGSKFETEFRVANLNSDYRWFLALGLPLKDTDNQVLQWVGSLTDVHEKKTQNEEMEVLVKERTLELQLARDEAIAARGVMANALDAKSRFISTISHEVRTPMTGIIGLAEVMKLQDLGDENNESMRAIFESAKRLLQLLNNVLDAAKLETGKVTLENRHFPLRSLLGDVRQLISPEANKKGLQISGNYDVEVPEFVCGDELRLRQVLLNLAFNAVKFTPKGTIDISANVVERVDTTVTIRFTVTDTGCGLNQEQIKRLFKPFEQAELSVSRVSGGTGLGLAICKDLVSLMGGKIGVDSEIKVGSTFWFELPFNEAACAI